MNVILLSGGSGRRLWPLSNDIRSKQFIRFLPSEDGGYESMLERVYRQIKSADSDARVVIAASEDQVSSIRNQLGGGPGISVEPCRRDTFPAIILAAAYLHDVMGVPEDETVTVCPADPYAGEDYFECLRELGAEAAKSDGLVLMGIEPDCPSEKYGYIIPGSTERISGVKTFREKPDEETAREYIAQGALWNGGVFAFRTGYVLEKARRMIGFTDWNDLYSRYETLEKISFDYAFVEKESGIRVLRFGGEWKDIGTWNDLASAMAGDVIGCGIKDDTCSGVYIFNELGIPAAAAGLSDVVIAASPDGILVSSLEASSRIKPMVDRIGRPAMYAERAWGSFRVVDTEDGSLTVRVQVNEGCEMSCRSMSREIYTVLSGEGTAVTGGERRRLQPGDTLDITSGEEYTVRTDSGLAVIVIQLGRKISAEDRIIYETDK